MSKDQVWFNGQYSRKENINIAESKKLKLKGSLKIKDFMKLKSIILKNFELTNLEISGCFQLTKVDLSELSILTKLSVTKCPNITTLNYSTGLTNLEISDSQLKEIDLSKLTKLTSLSVTDCQKLTRLNCSSTRLTILKIINCPQLNKIIDKSKSKTKSLYVRGYSNLSTLDCSETGFTNLEINGCSQLNEVNLSKLSTITSLSVIDCLNLTKLDCSSNGLTSLKISGCYRLEKFDFSKLKLPQLTSLSVIDCLKLTELDCSNSEITDLEVSDLTELDCSNTSIKELSLNLCPDITKLDCSNNKKLKNLDVSNCFKLGSIDCSNSKLTSLDLIYCLKSITVKPPGLNIIQEKKNIKNILIVGRTGGGKSTLANVLTNTEEFKESAYAVSETKIFRKIEFKWKGINFRVVDTIGAGDTKLVLKDVLYKIADGIYAMPEGISQILFVVDGRFTKEEISTFNMIKDSILQIDILGYVTLVRTKFSNFRSKEECGKDKEKMLEENEKIAEIVRKCNDVIHVDNPPIKIEENDEGDNDYIAQIKVNRNARQKSRQKLLEYLGGVDPVKKNQYFKLKTWDKLLVSIRNYVRTNEDAQKMLENDPELEAFYNASKDCLIL